METVGLRDHENPPSTDCDKEFTEPGPALRDAGKVSWNGGKPAGLRGVKARGKPVAETVIEDRR